MRGIVLQGKFRSVGSGPGSNNRNVDSGWDMNRKLKTLERRMDVMSSGGAAVVASRYIGNDAVTDVQSTTRRRTGQAGREPAWAT
jgi:hypothetical protein